MAHLGGAFIAGEIERTERPEFVPIPTGTEVALHTTEAALITTKNGGQAIKVKDEVLDGPHKGRWLTGCINIVNANPQTQAIGLTELAERVEACGLAKIEDTDELLYRPFRAVLGVKPGSNGYGPQNVIKKYLKPGQVAAPSTAVPKTSAVSASPPPTAGRGKRPWEK